MCVTTIAIISAAAGEPVDFPSDAQRHMPQPQTAYDGPAGSVCPAVQQDTVSSSVLLTMPGPGYFSSLPVSSAASHAAAVMTSLVSKSHSPVSPGLTPAQVTEAGDWLLEMRENRVHAFGICFPY